MNQKSRFVEGEAGRLAVMVSSEIYVEMDRQEVTQSELARRMGVTRQDVQAILDGGRPMTLRTLAKFSYGLGMYFGISIRKDVKPSSSETWQRKRSRAPKPPRPQSKARAAGRRQT